MRQKESKGGCKVRKVNRTSTSVNKHKRHAKSRCLFTIRCLDEIEYKTLVNSQNGKTPLHARDLSIAKLLALTGMRVSELVHTKIGYLMNNGTIKNSFELPSRVCKARKARLIHLNKKAKICVQDILSYYQAKGCSNNPCDYLIRNKQGERMSRVALWKIIKKIAQNIGLPHSLSPHWLRHSNATALLREGTPTMVVKEILGHSSLSVTERYLHVTSKDMAKWLGVL